MNNFEEKRAARIERLKAAAAKREAAAGQYFEKAHNMAAVIPFGQPILVGHHSEGRDRRYRDKIHNNMDKGVQTQREAEKLADRAAAAENNTAIFSDDPEAIRKLKEKLKSLQDCQELMKSVNAIIRKKKLSESEKIAEIIKAGLTGKQAAEIMQPDFLRPHRVRLLLSTKQQCQYKHRKKEDRRTRKTQRGTHRRKKYWCR